MCPEPAAEVTIRRAEAADATAILRLARAVHIHARHLDWRNFAVATAASGEVVGCCQVRPCPGGAHELRTVAVARAWQHRGVARALGEFIVPASPRPLYGICLASMAGFYERFGAGPAANPPRRLRWERTAVNLFLRVRGRRDRAVIMCLGA
jgi:predicted N-acetyltransferase YhbS